MQLADVKIKSAEIQAVVIRADGTREDLGTVAYYHRNPFNRFIHWIKTRIKRG